MKYTLIGILLILMLSSSFALTDTNLVSWFKLNETSGTIAANSKDPASAGTLTGTNYILGGAGANLTQYSFFNNTTVYVDTNTRGVIDGTKAGAIVAWVKSDAATVVNDGILISRGSGASGIFAQSSQLMYCLFNAVTADYTGVGDINGAWHMIVCTQDGTYRKGYVDGQQVSTGNAVAWSVTANWNIARDSAVSTRIFDGNIDEVSIWKGGLTSADVNYLYNNRNALTYCSATGTFEVTCGGAPDPCAPTTNADWTINTAITCENKRIELGTGKLIFNTGGSLKLYDSNVKAAGIKMNGYGKFLQIFARSFLQIK